MTQLHYGPSRQRYKRIDTGTQNRTTYYMGAYEKEVRADKTIHRIQLGDFAIVEKVDSNPEQIQYTIRDDLGSLIATVSDTGQIKRLNFDPWGKRLDLPVAESQPIDLLSLQNFVTDRGFTGHEHLDGSGLIHMNGRVYDPVIARFISADPLIQAPSYLQSHNRYSYVWNNPLRYTDPSGFSTEGKSTWEKTKDFFSNAWESVKSAAKREWTEAKERVKESGQIIKAKVNGTYDPTADRWSPKYEGGDTPYYGGDDSGYTSEWDGNDTYPDWLKYAYADSQTVFPVITETFWREHIVNDMSVDTIGRVGEPTWVSIDGGGWLLDKVLKRALNLDIQIELQKQGIYREWEEYTVETAYSVRNYQAKIEKIGPQKLTGNTEIRYTGIETSIGPTGGIRACPVSCNAFPPVFEF